MRKTIETSIEINAAPEKIWKILSDLNDYGKWNPFIPSIQGRLEVGNKIAVLLNPPGGGKLKFRPVLLASAFPEIRWMGKLFVKGLFDGEHYFRLEPISKRSTRFVHGENFSGVLVSLFDEMLKKTSLGFEMMNEALKAEAEKDEF